jgi:hypothetical protein
VTWFRPEQHHELVSSEAGCEVGRAHAVVDDRARDTNEYAVSGVVTVAVVDVLESVHVEHQDGQLACTFLDDLRKRSSQAQRFHNPVSGSW